MIPSEWRTASDCNGASSCVEVASVAGSVLVRDSKLGDASPILRVPVPSWWSFLAAVKTGQTLTYGGVLWVADVDAGWLVWLRDEPDVTLWFDRAEVAAFVAGVRAGQFEVVSLASGMHGSDGTGRARASEPPLTAL
ncbi:DUF397 domain-containing protein [Nonomuraea sp. NPDC048901]|uniref:DUF397 domain-containing protein n=1 Tax=Nonomuraea sp. NPDC048901 TaxID=3155627 RepID=UPI0033CCE55A